MENKHLIVGLCLVAAILFIFCPSKEKHCEHLANEIHLKYTEQSILVSTIEIFSGIFLEDDVLISEGIIDGATPFLTSTENIANELKTQVEYNHYGIFSTTTSSEGETLSFGILGMVIITTEKL